MSLEVKKQYLTVDWIGKGGSEREEEIKNHTEVSVLYMNKVNDDASYWDGNLTGADLREIELIGH